MSMTPLSASQVARTTGTDLPSIDDSTEEQGAADFRPLGKRRLILKRFLRNRMAVLGLVLLGLIAAFAIFGHLLPPWHYT